MPKKKPKKDVDVEVDFHGSSAAEMRVLLQKSWPSWRGMWKVRVIHGQGVALKPELASWCREMGIAFETEAYNPGSTILYPDRRTSPDSSLSNTLAAQGLSLTPEQQTELRDPQAILRAKHDALRKKQELERLQREAGKKRLDQKRIDDSLWSAEVARLDRMDTSHKGKAKNTENIPAATIYIPPSVIKFQEGYWRAEIVRVGDTDTETLQLQKKTGLDKLAPPIEPVTQAAEKAHRSTSARSIQSKRNEAADTLLFEQEMARLLDESSKGNQ